MEYDPVRNIYLLDPLDAKSLDKFAIKFIVVKLHYKLINLEHLPLVDNSVWAFDYLHTIMLDV